MRVWSRQNTQKEVQLRDLSEEGTGGMQNVLTAASRQCRERAFAML